MNNLVKLKTWRTEEIAKLFLLKSSVNLVFETANDKNSLFDFYLHLVDKPNVKFAIEVKTHTSFERNINNQIQNLKGYRNTGIIDLPVLLFKINEESEKGELDFLIIPSIKEKKLLVRYDFSFVELTDDNFKTKVKVIENWFKTKKPTTDTVFERVDE